MKKEKEAYMKAHQNSRKTGDNRILSLTFKITSLNIEKMEIRSFPTQSKSRNNIVKGGFNQENGILVPHLQINEENIPPFK